MKTNVNYAELEYKVYSLIEFMCEGDYTMIDPEGKLYVTIGNVQYAVHYRINSNKSIDIIDYSPL